MRKEGFFAQLLKVIRRLVEITVVTALVDGT